MRIPSYDDLTPSIPDITPRETFEETAKFLPRADPPAELTASPIDAFTPSSPLYACVCDPSAFAKRATARQGVCSTSSDNSDAGSRTPDPGSRNPPHASRHFLIARDFSPRIERHGDSSVVLDISGLGGLLGSPHAIGAELARAADGYAATVRIAIARSQTAARLLAIAHRGPTIADGDATTAIRVSPIDTLRMCIEEDEHDVHHGGAAARLKATADRLDTFRRWGLTTLGEIAALPAMPLSERMGQEGLALQQLARGV